MNCLLFWVCCIWAVCWFGTGVERLFWSGNAFCGPAEVEVPIDMALEAWTFMFCWKPARPGPPPCCWVEWAEKSESEEDWRCWSEGEGMARFWADMLPLLWCSSEFPPKYPDDCAKTGDWAEPGALLFAIFAMLAAFRAAICFSRLRLWNIPDVPIPASWPDCVSWYCGNIRVGELACPWFCCLAHAHESAGSEHGARKGANLHCALSGANGVKINSLGLLHQPHPTRRIRIPPSSQFSSFHFSVSSCSGQPRDGEQVIPSPFRFSRNGSFRN